MSGKADVPGDAAVWYRDVVYRMFLQTADEDYVLARTALLNGDPRNFLWLSLHSLEKYLKAACLLHGHSVRSYKHDIGKLHDDLMRLDPSVDAVFFRKVDAGQAGDNEAIRAFVGRLNDEGEPNNRYNTGCWAVQPGDVHKVDQLAWLIRYRCRAAIEVATGREPAVAAVEPDVLQHSFELHWQINQGWLLERLVLDNSVDVRRTAFVAGNIAFIGCAENRQLLSRMSGLNGPIALLLQRITKSTYSSKSQAVAAEVLRTCLDRIWFSGADARGIEGHLDDLARRRSKETSR